MTMFCLSRRLTDTSSDDDEAFEIREEEQEQILAEVLRDNRKLEVRVNI